MSEMTTRMKPTNFLELNAGKHPDKTAVIGPDRSMQVDPEFGETVPAFVVMEKGSQGTEESIKEYCAQRMANQKIPVTIVFLDTIPRTPTGKILKRELREFLNAPLKA